MEIVSGAEWTSETVLKHIIFYVSDFSLMCWCCCSVVQSFPTICNPINSSMPGFLHYLPEIAQTHDHWLGDAIQPSHTLLLTFSLALNLSQHQGLFQWVRTSHQVAKVLELQLQHQSSIEYSGLISLRIDWLDLCAIQRALKTLLQHHFESTNLKASIIWHLAFFMEQFSHPHMVTRKTIALTMQTFVSKVISLLFNMLSRFVMGFWWWLSG